MARNKNAKTTTTHHTGDFTDFDAKWDRMEELALRANVAVNTPEIAETAKLRAVRDAVWGEYIDAVADVADVIGWDAFALRTEIAAPGAAEILGWSEPMYMDENGEMVIITEEEDTATRELAAACRDENGWVADRCATFGVDVAACRLYHRELPTVLATGCDGIALAA